jgi:RNA polymerase sigma factor (sigma-70 family)
MVTPFDSVAEATEFPLSDEALGNLLDVHRRSAFNLAYRLLRRPDDAADAVQDAFVLAIRAMRQETAAPRDPSRFGGWLLKIVANVALGRLRREHRGSTISLDDAPSEPPDTMVEQPLTILVRREQRSGVLQALLALPDTQRAALTLREYQGLSYDEIGDVLGLNRDATTALLYRARGSFRVAYEGLAARSEPVGCVALAPLLSAMLDDELDLDTWQHVDHHVKGCHRCQDELRALRRSRRIYAAIPLLAPPAGWTLGATLEAVGTAVTVADVAPAMTAAVVTPTTAGVVGSTGLLSGASISTAISSLGSLLVGKLAGVAVATGIGVSVALASLSEDTTASPTVGAVTVEQPASGPSEEPPELRAIPLTSEQPLLTATVTPSLPAPPAFTNGPQQMTTPQALVSVSQPPQGVPPQAPALPAAPSSVLPVQHLAPTSVSSTTVPPPATVPPVSPPQVAVPAPTLPQVLPTRAVAPTMEAARVTPPNTQPPTATASTVTLPPARVPTSAPTQAVLPAMHPTNITLPQVHPPAIATPSVIPSKIDPPAVMVPTVAGPKLDPPNANLPTVEPGKIIPPTVIPSKLDPPKVVPTLVPPPVDPPHIAPPTVNVPINPPPTIVPPKIDPPKVSVPTVVPPKIDPPKVSVPTVAPPQVGAPVKR